MQVYLWSLSSPYLVHAYLSRQSYLDLQVFPPVQHLFLWSLSSPYLVHAYLSRPSYLDLQVFPPVQHLLLVEPRQRPRDDVQVLPERRVGHTRVVDCKYGYG